MEQKQAVSAVLLESKKSAICEPMLSVSEISLIEHIALVLEPLAHATTMLCSEKVTSISFIQPVLTALLKRHLKQSEVDAKVVADMKNIITQIIKDRFRPDKSNALASAVDPRFKALQFLNSSERSEVFFSATYSNQSTFNIYICNSRR